jgi:hypothetical protein
VSRATPWQPQRWHPVVVVDEPAREHGAIGIEALPSHDEPELVQAAEHRQVRAAETGIRGSVVQRRGLS